MLLKDVVAARGLLRTPTYYTLRHSVIMDLIRARLPILTVAKLSGTSVAMIESTTAVRDDADGALASNAI